jgi:hypothetical protein
LFAPPETTLLDRLEVSPLRSVSLRPTGVPWFLPGELSGGKSGAAPGPGGGFSLIASPSARWRFGAELILRAERVGADNRPHDWTPYLARGMEFTPYPNSPHSFFVGLAAPWAWNPEGRDGAGAFFFIRWTERVKPAPSRAD